MVSLLLPITSLLTESFKDKTIGITGLKNYFSIAYKRRGDVISWHTSFCTLPTEMETP